MNQRPPESALLELGGAVQPFCAQIEPIRTSKRPTCSTVCRRYISLRMRFPFTRWGKTAWFPWPFSGNTSWSWCISLKTRFPFYSMGQNSVVSWPFFRKHQLELMYFAKNAVLEGSQSDSSVGHRARPKAEAIRRSRRFLLCHEVAGGANLGVES